MDLRVFFLALIFVPQHPSAATYSNEILSVGVGARALGMGGAYVGVADDSSAVYWNPAGLPKIEHLEVATIQQGQPYGGTGTDEIGSQYFFLSGGMTVPRLGTVGVAVMRAAVDGIPQVTAIDASGVPVQVGTFKTQDLALLASYGRKLGPVFSLGATLKYLSGATSGIQAVSGLSMGDATSSSYGIDIGTLVDLGGVTPSLRGLSFGLNLQDAYSSGVRWSNTPTDPTDKVDLNAKAGLAFSPALDFLKDNNSDLTVAMDADPKYGINTLMHYGGELWYRDALALRGGLRQFLGARQSIETSLGASFRVFFLQVDYAFITYELTPMHYLSGVFRF